MTEIVDYYFATVSPYAYFGHDRFTAIAKKYGATVAVKPINLGEVFPVSALSRSHSARPRGRPIAWWSLRAGRAISTSPCASSRNSFP
jgi:2-hydroxychromene-2-carboxylate isomerase